MPVYECVCRQWMEGHEGKKRIATRSDMKNDELLIYNLDVTWQSPGLQVSLMKALQDADSYLGCLAVTACPRVWRAGWRAEGCGEMECDHNWGCCRSPLLHNLKREITKRGAKLKFICPVESLDYHLINDFKTLKLWKVSSVWSVIWAPLVVALSPCQGYCRKTFIKLPNPLLCNMFFFPSFIFGFVVVIFMEDGKRNLTKTPLTDWDELL